jgi:hypothetical protein
VEVLVSDELRVGQVRISKLTSVSLNP